MAAPAGFFETPSGYPIIDPDTINPREDWPAGMQAQADWLDTHTILRFANKTALLLARPTMPPGQSGWAITENNGTLWRWRGTSNQWVPAGGRMPRASGTFGSVAALGAGAWSGLGWSVATTDADVFEVTAGKVRCLIAGEVQVQAQALFAATPAGQINVRILGGGSVKRSNVSTSDRSVPVTAAFNVAAGDLIEVQVYQNPASGSATRDVGGDASVMAFDVLWRGAA
ncbi:hypothetical protein [Knoellia sp. LjRoot47]|uniref:hypothetical protein n=1 Tax=Knoellia sp. LjRoot47 TaxID=3342330 RepID=UPI003ED04865